MRRLWPSFALLALPGFPQQPSPQPVQRIDPQYSEEALIAGLEGTVQFAARIGTDGTLHDVRVTRPLGLGLDEKALDAVTQWRFEPGVFPDIPQAAAIDLPVEFNLTSKFSRWHLIGAKFDTPPGVSRPVFVRASYPLGAGISPNAYEEGRLLGAIGRPANVTLAFEIDDHGRPDHFEVVKSSLDLWGFEAANVVSNWQFAPGTKDGIPVPVRCTLDLVWGNQILSTATIAAQLNVLHPPPAPAPSIVRPTPQFAPVALVQIPPVYTDRARAAGLEGVMWVTFNVGEDGTPHEIKVTEHLALGLDEQAILAISKWRFQPALLNGQPVSAPAVAEVFFQLSGVTAELVQPNLPAATRPAPRAVPQK